MIFIISQLIFIQTKDKDMIIRIKNNHDRNNLQKIVIKPSKPLPKIIAV